MAHRRSSIKKIRIDKKRRERNVRVVSELRTSARKVQTLITSKKGDDVVSASRAYFSQLDKAVKKGLMHKNEASRRKSRLQFKINSLKTQK
jgi:small subunit ribosomal protein S20